MVERFEQFSSSISVIYKYLQKLEKAGMEKYSLKGTHTRTLIEIGKHPDGITAAELSAAVSQDKAAVSRTVTELEAIGHIERFSESGNGYQAKIKLTESGKEAARKVKNTIEQVVVRAGEGLNEADRAIFYSSLDLIAENLKKIYLGGNI